MEKYIIGLIKALYNAGNLFNHGKRKKITNI